MKLLGTEWCNRIAIATHEWGHFAQSGNIDAIRNAGNELARLLTELREWER